MTYPEMSFLTILFISVIFPAIVSSANVAKTPPPPRALVLPVSKDPSTLQYLTTIGQRTPLVTLKLTVHLGGKLTWVHCNGYNSSTYRLVPCDSPLCKSVLSYPGSKPNICNRNTCSVSPDNEITGIVMPNSGSLAVDVISVQSTDGSNPGRVVSVPLPFSCGGSTALLRGLASGVKGMLGLGRQPVSAPSQLASALSFPAKFAICLSSSTSSNGVMFFGKGPYFFLPRNGIDFSKSLMYAKLFTNPASTADAYYDGEPSAEYFIGVKSITINNKTVPLNTTLLTINKKGFGGTKISTINPYTVMQRSIYRIVTGKFVKQLSGVPRVASVAPFKVCYSSKSLGSTRVGPAVPSIDLVLEGRKKNTTVTWMIFGANSMVPVNDHTVCLGLLDGGLEPRTSIVIGGFQLENNLLEFDIGRSRLGFTSSLLFRQTTCGNFNFTSNA